LTVQWVALRLPKTSPVPAPASVTMLDEAASSTGERSPGQHLRRQRCVPLHIAGLTAVCLRDPHIASLEAIPGARTCGAAGLWRSLLELPRYTGFAQHDPLRILTRHSGSVSNIVRAVYSLYTLRVALWEGILAKRHWCESFAFSLLISIPLS
jgi:hypothetical protein